MNSYELELKGKIKLFLPLQSHSTKLKTWKHIIVHNSWNF